MALEGSLKEFGLADILQLIYFQRKTGILTLEGRMDKIRLLFYEGNLVLAESKRRIETNRLGTILVKKGLIKDEDLSKALEEQQSTGAKLGNILIKNGLVEKEQIQEIVISQITETVTQLFGWKDGFYAFSPQGVPLDKDIPISLDTQHLLMEGLRILDEWSTIEGKLSLDTVLRRTGKSGIELTPDEEEILSFVDGESDVSTIVDKSQMDSFPALKLLLSIIEKDAVEPKEITPIVSASTPQGTKAVRIASVFSFARMGIVIAFIGAFLISVIPIFSEKNDAVYRLKAAEDVIGLRFEINAYRYEHGSYPSAIEHIKKITDPWGNIYIYKTEGNSFVLFSTGPDGKKGTADDIH